MGTGTIYIMDNPKTDGRLLTGDQHEFLQEMAHKRQYFNFQKIFVTEAND